MAAYIHCIDPIIYAFLIRRGAIVDLVEEPSKRHTLKPIPSMLKPTFSVSIDAVEDKCFYPSSYHAIVIIC